MDYLKFVERAVNKEIYESKVLKAQIYAQTLLNILKEVTSTSDVVDLGKQ